MCIKFEVVNNFNNDFTMKTFTKINSSILLEKLLTVLKNLPERHVTLTSKNLDIYRDLWKNMTFRQILLSNYDPIIG